MRELITSALKVGSLRPLTRAASVACACGQALDQLAILVLFNDRYLLADIHAAPGVLHSESSSGSHDHVLPALHSKDKLHSEHAQFQDKLATNYTELFHVD